MSTEGLSSRYASIDLWQADEIVDAMIEAQFAAVAAARAARSALQQAAISIEFGLLWIRLVPRGTHLKCLTAFVT